MKKIILVPLAIIVSLLAVPAWQLLRIDGLLTGRRAPQQAHADAVAAWALEHAGARAHSPGSAFFDAEWSFGTCSMVVMGLGQVALEHPELRERYLPAMEACLDWLVQPEARSFGTGRWGDDGADRGPQDPGHAYLGYMNLAMSMHRLLVPDSRYAALNDAISEQLAAGLASPAHRFQTYPGESYPVDQAVAAGSVGLHARATGLDRDASLADWSARFREAAVDPGSGWLVQRLDSQDGSPGDLPRGSGTALAAYGLLYADPALSRELHQALVAGGLRTPLGLGVIREYAPGYSGRGDIDSGPVILGFGVSATGFALAGARAHGDAAAYRSICRTATLFGLPAPGHGGRWFHTGGAIGNAIMLAMLTAPTVDLSLDS
jgi:hypothetical protein